VHFYPEERIVVLIDGINLNATHKSLEFDIDYKKLLALFRAKGRLIKAIFYTTVLEQQEYSSVRPLVDWLEYNGFSLVTKPAKEHIDAEGRRRIRGNMHVEMAVDALVLAPNADHFVLFAGEGGFKSLVEALQQKGKRVTVISTLQTRPPMVADELRRQSDQFVDLADLEPMIGRVRRPRPDAFEADDAADGEDDLEAQEMAEAPAPVSASTPAALDPASGKPAVVVEKRTTRPRSPVK
jgi:uncharacterized LabA/DUF88 family protein